jgi:hypothetical protein
VAAPTEGEAKAYIAPRLCKPLFDGSVAIVLSCEVLGSGKAWRSPSE